MADKKVKPAAPAAPAKSKKTPAKSSNFRLTDGVYRFSRSRQYHRKGLWKFVGKKTEKQVKPKKPKTVVKQIGGDKNGGTRTVLLKKRTKSYPTTNRIRDAPSKKSFSAHRRYVRPSLVPGTVCIIVAGHNRGKRVVLLKVLKSGLCLVNGPFKLNAVCLRRVHQNFLIATSTKIDVSGVKLPEKIDDEYFRRKREKRAKKAEGEIFAQKEEKYKPTEERKQDQKEIDKQVIAAIKKHPLKNDLVHYLKCRFRLRNNTYPHQMKF